MAAMDSSTIVLLGVISALAAWSFSRSILGKVPVQRARELVREGGRLVDVRTAKEFEGGHIPGALNIPLDMLDRRLEELRDAPAVVVYCQSGMRSARALTILKRNGFESAYDLGAMSRYWT